MAAAGLWATLSCVALGHAALLSSSAERRSLRYSCVPHARHCDRFSPLWRCAAVSFLRFVPLRGEVNLSQSSSVGFPEVPQHEPVKRVSGTVKVLLGYS